MGNKRKWLTVPIRWAKTLDPSIMVIEDKVSREDKEKNKDLLLVMWYVTLESRTQR